LRPLLRLWHGHVCSRFGIVRRVYTMALMSGGNLNTKDADIMSYDPTSLATPLSGDGRLLSSESDLLAGTPPPDAEAVLLAESRRRRLDELAKIDAEIDALQSQRSKLRRDLLAIGILLGDEVDINSAQPPEIASASPLEGMNRQTGTRSPRRHQPSEVLAQSVDAVMNVLQEHGPLHYREIYTKVAEAGVIIPGKDPAATLLSRFSRDPRVERVSAGTYRIIQHVVP